MLTTLPSGRLGRVIALSATLFLILMVWLAVVMPLRKWYGQGQALLTQQAALADRMGALAAQVPRLSQRAAALDASRGSITALLPGDTDALAAAKLQEIVQSLAAAKGVTLASVEILPAAPISHYRRIALRLSLVSRFAVLVELLQSVAQATPHMLVDDLSLEGAQLINQPVDTPLHAELTIFAFRIGGSDVGLSTGLAAHAVAQ
jgi:hypothetical protein